MARRKVKFGVIGLGLMGREFGSAAARWCHLLTDGPVPEIVGVCDTSETARQWFSDNFSSVAIATADYQELLAAKEIEAVYCAVPHHLHEQFYVDILRGGKHLMGEKPFGIDQEANTAILKEAAKHPELVVRCSSEFPFFPACQRLISWIREGRFGRIMEVRAGFNHSSDLDLSKPINWKRMIQFNGEYGCLGDLGIHTQHVPFRMGWVPKTVYGILSNIVPERPDGKGGKAPCLTWDNASLVCQVDHANGYSFPMTLETKRLDPGATNRWFIEVYGVAASARFTTDDPNAFSYLETRGKEQAWARVVVGQKTMIPSITGSIFEFGFSDGILQMWAAYLHELDGMEVPFGCFTPEESRLSHALQTAALLSHKNQSVERVRV
jgi:predicted dehydrogenase